MFGGVICQSSDNIIFGKAIFQSFLVTHRSQLLRVTSYCILLTSALVLEGFQSMCCGDVSGTLKDLE